MGGCNDDCPLHGRCSDDASALLLRMLDEAHSIYRNEVTGKGKLYSRFTADFINGHRYTDALCAAGKNAHNKALGIMTALLETRPNLAEEYLALPEFSHADAARILDNLDTGRCSTEKAQGKDKPRFVSRLTPKLAVPLAEIASKTGVFKGGVTADELTALLDCRLAKPLKSANNRRLAVFFDALADARLIERDWQKVLAANGSVTSSASDRSLSRSAISSALAEAKTGMSAAVAAIRKEVRKVAETAENDHTATN